MFQRYCYLRLRRLRVQRFLSQSRRMQSIQHYVLRKKIRRNQNSDYGLTEFRAVDDLRKRMPVTTCETYRDYVERVKQGDLRAMFGRQTPLLMFTLTSGTMNQSKFIPVTHDFFREYRKGWNLWGIRTFQQHLDLLRQHVVHLSSDWQQFPTVSGTPCGNISGLVAETAPRISHSIFILPRSLIKIPSTFGKHYAALRNSMVSERVGMIMTANLSTLVDSARFADQQR